jgi:hypothetical protein
VTEPVRLSSQVPDRTRDLDMETVRGAIELVAARAARRVVLVNLAEAVAVLPEAIAIGQREGVPVRGDRRHGNLAIEVGSEGQGTA